MRFARFLLILFFFAVTNYNAAAQQEKCALNLSNAPLLNNWRLGMTPLEAQTAVGGVIKLKNKTRGEYTFFQNYLNSAAPAPLNGLRVVYLRFFDGRLYQIENFYAVPAREKSLADFLAEQSEQMNLPLGLWKTEFGQARLDCADFSIVADNVLNPRIELTDEIIRARVEAEREK